MEVEEEEAAKCRAALEEEEDREADSAQAFSPDMVRDRLVADEPLAVVMFRVHGTLQVTLSVRR